MNAYRILKILMLFTFVGIGSFEKAYGKAGMHSELAIGHSSRDMKGIDGADFKSMQSFSYDLSFSYLRNSWRYSLGYLETPQVKLADVRWSDNSVGNYRLTFSKPYLGIGVASKKWVLDFLLGWDMISWSGDVEVDYKDQATFTPGLSFGYIYRLKQSVSKWSFPFKATGWYQSERQLKFDDKPSENSTIESGISYDLFVGARYEFF